MLMYIEHNINVLLLTFLFGMYEIVYSVGCFCTLLDVFVLLNFRYVHVVTFCI